MHYRPTFFELGFAVAVTAVVMQLFIGVAAVVVYYLSHCVAIAHPTDKHELSCGFTIVILAINLVFTAHLAYALTFIMALVCIIPPSTFAAACAVEHNNLPPTNREIENEYQ